MIVQNDIIEINVTETKQRDEQIHEYIEVLAFSCWYAIIVSLLSSF